MKVREQDKVIFELMMKTKGTLRQVLDYLEGEENIDDDGDE